ncbi:DUF1559 domain-containing protein [Stieleria sp. TO1_6]|uniref:DUF1559 family PulG-like putative transporter n=1 Tax=Stieleria tagensis TaxID=2956795 RepID=UPI00209B67A2|nr:DUF1559 domain-containing protein [Stieleria tagensis]MCO8121816.1 DUF1559 domain-containing protein [Stieleria tagensis]
MQTVKPTQRLVKISLLLTTFCLSLPACGPSQHDLMMRAARRQRPTSGDEQEQEAKPKKQTATAAVTTAASEPSLKVQPDEPDEPAVANVETTDQPEPPAVLKVSPIGQRVPEAPLSEEERRRHAFRSIKKIAQALERYHQKEGIFPPPYKTVDGGFKGLSWRVELLPYLGYETLYQKFDKSQPWNREPNQSLLELIPDEYVSPERFDTKTNFQLPAHPTFTFGEGRTTSQRRIEDGAENTILLLEVDDRDAVPWTSPEDYIPKNLLQMSQELGELRGDGTFACWANGWPTLLSNSVTDEQLRAAMTHETGDYMVASMIHRDIPVTDLTDGESQTNAYAQQLQQQLQDVAEAVTTNPGAPKPIETIAAIEREDLPIAADVAKAKDRLRLLYADAIGDAKFEKAKATLATRMLAQAEEMTADPAGAFALQTAALSLALESADAAVVIEAIDRKVLRFNVDAFETNVDALTRFSESSSALGRTGIEGITDLLKRLTVVIHACVIENDYLRAAKLTRFASRVSDRADSDEITRMLNRLRSQLGAAQAEYDKSVEFLQIYREQPENVQAAAAFGSFLCCFKGDWETGLPLIAKSESSAFGKTAALDLAGAATLDQLVVLGDAWWDLSQRGRGVYRQAAEDRAVMWYLAAFEQMPSSLERMHVKSRLAEAQETLASSPLALCTQLAEAFGADLSINLIALADPATIQRRLAKADRDED